MHAVIERDAVRLVVLDKHDSVLLLHTRDLSNNEFEQTWELPGGGVEPGESFLQAAARELREETGLDLSEGSLDTPRWSRSVLYSYRGERRLQHEQIALLRLSRIQPDIDSRLRVGSELDDHFEHRWWQIDELLVSRELFFPRSLAINLPALMRGIEIIEPLEEWPGGAGRETGAS